MRKVILNIFIIWGIIGIFLGVGCQTMGTGVAKAAKPEKLLPVNVELLEIQNIYVGKEASKEPIIVDILFRISNPNPILVNVDALEWTVSVEKTRLGAMAVQEGIYIPAKGEAQVRKTYFLNARMGPVNLLLGGAVINLKEGASVFGGICKAIQEERALWNLIGAAYVDSEIGSISVPFTAEFKQSPAPK
jgi:LEA14-like dessication related protein